MTWQRMAWWVILIVALAGVLASIFTHGTTVTWLPFALIATAAAVQLAPTDLLRDGDDPDED
jgi:hypothetical protein